MRVLFRVGLIYSRHATSSKFATNAFVKAAWLHDSMAVSPLAQ